ncbi:MAG TPA: preprotein translocase subunit YajC [Ilumatobacteraceae bacterium]|nr:preprotein translocase subunit YajC [Ilumatobacteraceae bacterium]
MSSHPITSLIAQESSSGGSSGAIIQLGILLLIPFAMYFFMIRPQRRRMREQQDLQRSIEVGDEVITTSGVYGVITGEDGDSRFWLEIDDDVQIRIARAAISGKSSPDDDTDAADDDVADDDAASAGADADEPVSANADDDD